MRREKRQEKAQTDLFKVFLREDKLEAEITLEHLDHVPMLEVKMNIIHQEMLDILKRLDVFVSVAFKFRAIGDEKRMCFPVIVSYCCNIPEDNNVSRVNHGLDVSRQCEMCMATTSHKRNLRH